VLAREIEQQAAKDLNRNYKALLLALTCEHEVTAKSTLIATEFITDYKAKPFINTKYKKHNFTKDQIQQMAELRLKEKWTYKSIGLKFGCAGTNVYALLIKRAGGRYKKTEEGNL
jgi:hypothetical protein